MANEQVRIDLVATDKASKTIDAVADDVEALEKADPEVTVTADDKASTVLDRVAEGAEALDKLDPEVNLGVADHATAAIADVRDEAEKLARADHELVLKARIDAARGELKTLRDDLEQTADKADDTNRHLDKVTSGGGGNLRGNAIADLTGPLGEASSAASDFAGVFDGIGDVAEGVAGKVGLSAEKMAGAIGGIGVAVAVAAAVWTLYKQRQDEARKKQEELNKAQRDFNQALREGKLEDAAQKLLDTYGDMIAKAEQAGVSVEEFTKFLTGQADELPGLNERIAEYNDLIERSTSKGKQATTALESIRDRLVDQRDALKKTRDANLDANSALAEQDERLRAVTGALGAAKRDADEFATSQERVEESTRRVNQELDRMKGELDVEQSMNDFKRALIDGMAEVGESALDQSDDVLALKQSVIDMGEQFKKSPLEIATVLDEVDAGELAQVARDVEAWYKAYPIVLASKLDRPGQLVLSSGGAGAGPRSVESAPTIGVLNMTLPTGWRGDPIRAAHVARRRSGRYYARTS